jgi:hypothetical protein
MIRKSVSVALGLISAFAGLVALIGYAIPAVEDLLPVAAGVVVYRGDSLLLRLLGAVLTCGLAAGAFYMAFRLLRDVLIPRKTQSPDEIKPTVQS